MLFAVGEMERTGFKHDGNEMKETKVVVVWKGSWWCESYGEGCGSKKGE